MFPFSMTVSRKLLRHGLTAALINFTGAWLLADPADTTAHSYRGLVLSVKVFLEDSDPVKFSTGWGYEVCVDEVQHGTRVLGAASFRHPL